MAAMHNQFANLAVDPDAEVTLGTEEDVKKNKNKSAKAKKREKKRMEKAALLLSATTQPGYLGNLKPDMQKALDTLRANTTHCNFPNCLDGCRSGLTDADLLRFLRARDFNVKKAQDMLEAAVAWRKEFRPDNIKLADIRVSFDRGGTWRHGHDKLGRPLVFSRSGLHDPAIGEIAVNTTMYLLEECINICRPPMESYSIIFDLTGYQQRNSDINWCRQVIGYLQNYYPERMGLALICNAPFVFKMLWTAIKPLLTKRTTDKIVFLGGDYKEKLLMYVDRAQLPPFLGGTDRYDIKEWIAKECGPPTDPRARVDPDWLAAVNSGSGQGDFDEDSD